MAGANIPWSGKLEEHSIQAVLRAIQRERRDGCLTVSRGKITRRLYLYEGMIVYGSSNERQDRLGEILILQGKLSKADHKKYWEKSQAEGRRLGMTLVVNGRITPHDLYQGVTAQVVTIIDRLQKWRTGVYDFQEGQKPEPGTVLLRIPLALYLPLERSGKAKKGKKTEAKRKKTETRDKTPAPKPAVPMTAPEASVPQPEPEPPSEEHEIDIPEERAEATSASNTMVQESDFFDENERIGEVGFYVQELLARIGQPPAALLGVPPDADQTAVRQAYHRLAKVLHPDRIPKGIPEDLGRDAAEVFREVTAAFEVLSAEKTVSPAAPAPAAFQRVRSKAETENQARRHFLQGREFISKRNYWQAADSLRQAVRLDPDEAIYRSLLGLSLVQTKRLHEAEEHLVEATRLDPSNAAHFINLGRVYRSGRLFRKAHEAFERALRLDPKNESAREELADLPEETTAKKSGGSFLKKLFGKG